MHRFAQGGVAGERWSRGSIVSPHELASIGWLHSHADALRPGQLALPVAPEPRKRGQRRTGGRQPHAPNLVWPPQALGGVYAAVVQGQPVDAARKRGGEGLRNDLAVAGRQIRPLQQAALAGGRRHRPIHGEPREDRLGGAHGSDASGGEAPSTHGQWAKAPVVWAAHAPRAGVLGRDDVLPPLATGRLKLGERVSVCLCGWGAAP
jgi:hypothetical protein